MEIPSLEFLNSSLSHCATVNARRAVFRAEAYSCKAVSTDRKLYKKLETKYLCEMGCNSVELSTSPGTTTDEEEWVKYHPTWRDTSFGPMTRSSARKTLFFLISVLNSVFPDYDFSEAQPEHFHRHQLSDVVSVINTNVIAHMKTTGSNDIARQVWDALEDSIKPKESEIYSYVPDSDNDPFTEDGGAWMFNFFFLNRKLKRIVF
ncbi:Maf1 regulator, partial [Rozella allomycis CSF55]